jgi:transcription antitermination factor NusB
MRSRTLARQAAVQALYQWEMQGEEFRQELDRFLAEWTRDSKVAAFARELIEGVISRQAEIDKALSEAARNWSLDRMTAVDRSVLRLGAYELLARDDIPPRVAINEAVDLAKKFSTKESGAFVNGVLDRIMTSAKEKASPGAFAAKRIS